MSILLDHHQAFATPGDEQPILQRAMGLLRDHPLLRAANVDGNEVSLPDEVAALLQYVIGQLARGEAAILMPATKELRLQEAADFLNVSRQFLLKLLDAGEIPFHKVRTSYRIRFGDLAAYQQRRAVLQEEGMREIARLSQEMGLYDDLKG
jgi:excisionase family DNA binding protein